MKRAQMLAPDVLAVWIYGVAQGRRRYPLMREAVHTPARCSRGRWTSGLARRFFDFLRSADEWKRALHAPEFAISPLPTI